MPLVVGPTPALRVKTSDLRPSKVPITLNINSKLLATEVEPGATLLDTLRNELN